MLNLKSEKIWLSHYVAGIAAADSLIGVPKRQFDIDLSQMLADHPADAARKVWLACRSAFVFSPTRFFVGCDPGAITVASLAKSFSGLAGVAALANLFGDKKLPSGAVSNVVSDLKAIKLQWQAVTAESVSDHIFEEVWEGTSSFFQVEAIRECVDELAAMISASGKLRNCEGELDAWFEERSIDLELSWAEVMPVSKAQQGVLIEYQRWARAENYVHDHDCGYPATITGKPVMRTPPKEGLYG